MTVADALRIALRAHLSALSLDTVLQRHVGTRAISASALAPAEREALASKLEHAIALFSGTSRDEIRAIVRRTLELDAPPDTPAPAAPARVDIPVHSEVDVSVSRTEARRIAGEAGLSAAAAVKVATSVSELARNIVLYAGKGAIALETERAGEGRGPCVRITATDAGPGIEAARLESILSGSYVSKSGLGKGIAAVRRIADRFDIQSRPGAGTTIVAEFRSPR